MPMRWQCHEIEKLLVLNVRREIQWSLCPPPPLALLFGCSLARCYSDALWRVAIWMLFCALLFGCSFVRCYLDALLCVAIWMLFCALLFGCSSVRCYVDALLCT